jgi:hypothetical protein
VKLPFRQKKNFSDKMLAYGLCNSSKNSRQNYHKWTKILNLVALKSNIYEFKCYTCQILSVNYGPNLFMKSIPVHGRVHGPARISVQAALHGLRPDAGTQLDPVLRLLVTPARNPEPILRLFNLQLQRQRCSRLDRF